MKIKKVDVKNHTLNYNLDIIINNIKQNYDEINENYADYLISLLELLKTKDNKGIGINKQKGYAIKDIINDKEYLSIRDAERETGIPFTRIKKSIDKEPILLAYKFIKVKNVN